MFHERSRIRRIAIPWTGAVALHVFASRLARLATFRGFAGEYFRLPVEASLASCNRVESSSMVHSFPLQGWNGDLNQSGFISRRLSQPRNEGRRR